MTPAGPPARATPARRPAIPGRLLAFVSAAMVTLGFVVAIGGDTTARTHAAAPLDPVFHGLALGVDASSWQHPHGAHVNWHDAGASGQSFAFIKATEGTGPANRHYEADTHAARSAGMLTGGYHMARPAMEPAQQAHAFADRLQAVGGPQLPPVLDLEYDEGLEPAELAEWTQVFLDTLRHRTGRTAIIYTYRSFWIDRMANTTRFADHPLWLAEYGVSQPTTPMIGGWDAWSFWQRADTGRVPGFTDDVDLNVFAGTRADLDAWSGPVTPVPDPAPAPAPAPEPAPEPVAATQPAPDPVTDAPPVEPPPPAPVEPPPPAPVEPPAPSAPPAPPA